MNELAISELPIQRTITIPKTVDERQSSRDLEVVEKPVARSTCARARCTLLLPREDERESCYSR